MNYTAKEKQRGILGGIAAGAMVLLWAAILLTFFGCSSPATICRTYGSAYDIHQVKSAIHSQVNYRRNDR